MIALAAATLASEDGACIAAGLLIARGALGPAGAVTACWAGIVAGDILLFLVGRWIARRLSGGSRLASALRARLASAPARWVRRSGPLLIVGARFIPGARLPSYLAAGALGTRFPLFAAWVALGAALSTPLLVGASTLAAQGTEIVPGGGAPAPTLAAAAAALVALRLLPSLATYRGRRLLVSSWRRITRWEFWPAWVFYVPVALGVLLLALRHRSLALFTAANPSIPGGGLVGESKSEILEALRAAGAPVAPFLRVRASLPVEERLAEVAAFAGEPGSDRPIVVKPDVGQRGTGVRIVRERSALEALVRETDTDLIVQRWVPGPEFGVFYVRRPGDARGRIFSITRKVLPEVVGDGRRSLERLILADDRAVCMARLYLERFRDRLDDVPREGERILLAEIGSHCRGAVFLNGASLATPSLEERIDAISRGYEGFFFGRYDLKAPSVDAFREGRDLTILELNGVGSESTDIYDPTTRLFTAWRRILEQWRIAFETGAANRSLGVRPMPLRRLLWERQRS